MFVLIPLIVALVVMFITFVPTPEHKKRERALRDALEYMKGRRK